MVLCGAKAKISTLLELLVLFCVVVVVYFGNFL